MNSDFVLFSIIVPIYNCDKYLGKLIESVLNQTYKNFELILINDGSTDKTLEICNQFLEKNSNIVVIDKENTGVSDTRNLGIKKSKGKYVLFLDADDYIDNEYLQYIVTILEKYNYNLDLVNFGILSEIYNNGKKHIDKINYDTHYYSNSFEIKKDLINLWDSHMLCNIYNKVYVKKILEDNNLGFANQNFGEDVDFNMKYVEKISTLYNSEKCFYHYIRERVGAATEKYNENLFKIREDEYIKFNKYFKRNNLNFEEYIEFSSRRFVERVIGCAENLYKGNLNYMEKRKKLKNIIANENVRFALKYAKCRSLKMKVLVFPLKFKMVDLWILTTHLVFFIKQCNPALFYKLKNRR